MPIKITSRFDDSLVILEVQSETLVSANLRDANLRDADLLDADLQSADLQGANLHGADLRHASLWRANLQRADLRHASLQCADLRGADLRGANLQCADLRRSDLRRVNLAGAKIDWQSHDLIAEILRLSAGDDWAKRQLAGGILISPDWCHDRWMSLEHPLRDWAIGVLSEWVQEGDDAPEYLVPKPTESVGMKITAPDGENGGVL